MPPGFTKYRPNDQRMFNVIFRWQYDVALSSLTGKADFHNPGVNTDVHIVLAAVAIAVHWMNQHPECCVAVWLVSSVITDEDYIKAGASALLARAKAAMQDPAHREIRRIQQMWLLLGHADSAVARTVASLLD